MTVILNRNSTVLYWHIGMLLFAGILSHGLLLIGNWLVWDGWEVADMLMLGRWDYFARFWSDSGHGIGTFIYRPFCGLSREALIHKFKLAGFLMTIGTGVLLYFMLAGLGTLTERERLFASIAVVTYPAFSLSGEPSIFLYQFGVCLYLLGMLILVWSMDMTNWRRVAARVVVLILIFYSFMMQALLSAHFAVMGLLLYIRFKKMACSSLATVTKSFLGFGDLLILPFLFYGIKQVLDAPAPGLFAAYYALRLSSAQLLATFRTLITGPVLGPSARMLELISSGFVGLSVVASGSLVISLFVLRYTKPGEMNQDRRKALPVLLFAVILLVLSAVPFAAVGQGFSYSGWTSKNSLLFAVPVGVLLVGLGRVLTRRGFRFLRGVLASVYIVGSVSLCTQNYLRLQGLSVRDRSAMLNVSKICQIRAASAIGFVDKFKLPEVIESYPGLVWTYMFKACFGDNEISRLWIVMPPENGSMYSHEELLSDLVPQLMPYAVHKWHAEGQQRFVLLEPGPGVGSLERMALRYWITTLSGAEAVKDYLGTVSKVTCENSPDRIFQLDG